MVLPRLSVALLVAAGCAGNEQPLRPPHPIVKRDELRPTDTSSTEMWKFLPTDVVENYDEPDSGFRVHFTRAGPNAVPPLDANANGLPDMVESVVGVYDQVATKYQTTMGYRAPLGDAALADNGGSERFDIYLLDFALAADGAFRTDVCTAEKCIGYVVQENDFVGFGYPNATVATRILGSHEYFHATQDAYDNGQDVVITEGTAVWATEQFDPSTNDFEGFLDGFMSRPERSLDSPPPGPVPAYAYGSAIFFEFLSEKYGQPIVRKLWERLENGQGSPSEPADLANPHWMIQLDALLKSDYQSSFAQAYLEFVRWNFYTASSADPAKGYANGANYPSPALTTVAAPYQEMVMRVYYASAQYFAMPAASRSTMGALLIDDPATVEDETAGLALVLSARRSNVNSALLTVGQVKAGAELIDTSGSAQLVVAVVNTAREGVGSVLSKHPALCIGSPQELRDCRIALDPSFDAGAPDAGPPDAGPPDAGPPDAGVDAGVPPDAGSDLDAGTTPPPPSKGCGCNSTGSVIGAWALVFALRGRRRPQAAANCRSTSRL
jgi:hypothetical protein